MTTIYELNVSSPRVSFWGNVGKALLNLLAACGFCGDQQLVADMEDYRLDNRVRGSIREEMRSHMGYDKRETCVGNAIDVTLKEDGYDLGDLGTIRKANQGVKRTYEQWERYFSAMGVNPLHEYVGEHHNRAKIIPRFASACALHIRTKLGKLTLNEANLLLVQRKYLEICRLHGVRDVDTVLHQQFVMNAVFTEGVLDQVATVRRRLPGWVRWLDGVVSTPPTGPTAC